MPLSFLRLLEGNRLFVDHKMKEDPRFFERLADRQTPEFLWIGCADSRVPADQITGTQPGEIFVHRNVANLVVHTDVSVLTTIDYAVKVLGVKHIIVCGHYACGGVRAAMTRKPHGLIDNWLRNIKDVYRLHQAQLEAIEDPRARERRMVELNVIEQAYNVCKTSTVQESWEKTSFPHVHGWVYEVGGGHLKPLTDELDRDVLGRIYNFDPFVAP